MKYRHEVEAPRPRTSDTPKPEISSYAPQVACWATGVAVHALVSHPIILFTGRRRHHLQGAATIQVPCASPAPPRPHFSHFHSRPLIRNHRRYPPDLPACARRLYGTKCAEGRAAGKAVEHAEGGRAMQLIPILLSTTTTSTTITSTSNTTTPPPSPPPPHLGCSGVGCSGGGANLW